MVRGVLAGAKRPYHWSHSKPAIAASATVGTSGSIGERVSVVTASGTSRLSLTNASVLPIGANEYCTRPVIVSVSTSGTPLYGMCETLNCSARISISPVMCVPLPMPAEP